MIIETIKILPPIHQASYKFIAIGLILTLACHFFKLNILTNLFLLFTIFCLIFFRNPKRIQPDNTNDIVSAADGIVTSIQEVKPPKEFGFNDNDNMIRISTFLSVVNVHVNRIPTDGKITKTYYYPGKFINATLDKSSDENERQLITISKKNGDLIGVTQIAGLIARRIVCNVKAEQEVHMGDELGIIQFGSRVDLYLPKKYKIHVKIGQTMIGGETLVAST